MGTYANMFAKIVFINQERKSDVQGQSETSLGWPKAASKPLFLRNAGLFTIREWKRVYMAEFHRIIMCNIWNISCEYDI